MNRHQISWALVVSAAAFAPIVCAAASLEAVGSSSVKFEAVGPAGLKINGESGGVKVTEQDGKLKITAPTTTFQTGIGLRDRHLRDYLESEKHPEATLVVERAAIKTPESGSVSGTVMGQLTLHGVTKPTKVAYKATRHGSDLQVEGDMDLKIADYQIKKPCYLGVCVEDAVKVGAEFTVRGE